MKKHLAPPSKEINNFRRYVGFTMAEAILVMTILGIIATIMITTLKPAEYKNKGLKVLANKVMSEIDTATTMILTNDSLDGTMHNLVGVDGNVFSIRDARTKENADKLGNLYKKYLTATRKECSDNSCRCYKMANTSTPISYIFYLKDGACIKIHTKFNDDPIAIMPGETERTAFLQNSDAAIFLDINAEEEPNKEGQDTFIFRLDKDGIMYAD